MNLKGKFIAICLLLSISVYLSEPRIVTPATTTTTTKFKGGRVQETSKSSEKAAISKATVNHAFDEIRKRTRKFFAEKRADMEAAVDAEGKVYEKLFDEASTSVQSDVRAYDKAKLAPFDEKKPKEAFVYLKQNIENRAVTLKAELRNALKEAAKNVEELEDKEQTKTVNALAEFQNDPNALKVRLENFVKAMNESFDANLKQVAKEAKKLLADEHARNVKSVRLQKETLLKDLSKLKDKSAAGPLSKKIEAKFKDVEKKVDEERAKTVKSIEESLTRKEMAKKSEEKGSDTKMTEDTSTMFKYGVAHGDLVYNKTVDQLTVSQAADPARNHIGPIKVSVKVPYFGDTLAQLYIDPYGSFVFKPAPRRKSATAVDEDLDAHFYEFDYFAAYQSFDLCNVYHREIKDWATLSQIGNEVKQVVPASEYTTPTWAYLATFYKKDTYLRSSRKNTTVQAVIATNGKYTVGLVVFKTIINHKQAAYIGYNKLNGEHFTVRHDDLFDEGKLMADVMLQSSNYEKAGKWIFRLDKKEPKLLTKLKSEFKDEAFDGRPTPTKSTPVRPAVAATKKPRFKS